MRRIEDESHTLTLEARFARKARFAPGNLLTNVVQASKSLGFDSVLQNGSLQLRKHIKSAIEANNPAALQLFLDFETYMNGNAHHLLYSYSVLLHAINSGCDDCATLLIKYAENNLSKSRRQIFLKEPEDILDSAAKANNTALCTFLIQHYKYSNTSLNKALGYAIEHHNIALVNALLKAGLALTKEHLSSAIESGFTEFIPIALDNGLHITSVLMSVERVEYLAAQKANLNDIYSFIFCNTLTHSRDNAYLFSIDLTILPLGVHYDTYSGEILTASPFGAAYYNQCYDICRALIKYGANWSRDYSYMVNAIIDDDPYATAEALVHSTNKGNLVKLLNQNFTIDGYFNNQKFIDELMSYGIDTNDGKFILAEHKEDLCYNDHGIDITYGPKGEMHIREAFYGRNLGYCRNI